MCGTRVAEEVVSPDGGWKAVIFERDCGATTDFSTQVSIIKSSRKIDDDDVGNVFIADSDHNAVHVHSVGVMDVSVQWKDDNELQIEYPERARIFKKEAATSGKRLVYHPR